MTHYKTPEAVLAAASEGRLRLGDVFVTSGPGNDPIEWRLPLMSMGDGVAVFGGSDFSARFPLPVVGADASHGNDWE